jgi:hypothetical protein
MSALGCQSGGVGDPCIPEDEYQQKFNGYGDTEVNIESKSFQCDTRVCIVNHFEGRVSCPYGQTDQDIASEAPTSPKRCRIPGTNGQHCVVDNGNGTSSTTDCASPNATNIDVITVPVKSQKLSRNADDTVYCSCRCHGPDPDARYCECPSGYECIELVRELGLPGKSQLAGSYCTKSGTIYSAKDSTASATTCAAARDSGESTVSEPGKTYNVHEICDTPGSPKWANP